MKINIILIFILAVNIQSQSQTCLVDTLIKELNIDSTLYTKVDFQFVHNDTLEFNAGLNLIKITSNYAMLDVYFNDTLQRL